MSVPVVKPGGLLCRLGDLPDPSSKLFVLKFDDGEEVEIFLARRGDEVFGYVNSCPHEDMPLQCGEQGSFLSLDKRRIFCQVHGASFDMATGCALSGPALPDGCLMKVPLVREGEDIRLAPR
ncbi:MAG: Rieske (2Fe-2S) protein [Alphaproteobacteria bacterium]